MPVKLSGLLLLAALAVVSACGATSASTHGPGAKGTLSDFRNEYLEFAYPPAWRAQQPAETAISLHFKPIVYVSEQATGDACHAVGSTVTCGWPVAQLQPGGVLIVWENRGYPGWALSSMPGTAIRVGGRPARRVVGRPGVCRSIGADETVQVAIARPIKSNWTAFTACLRGPALADRERDVDALLASTRFKGP
jgi:hypothetical protein